MAQICVDKQNAIFRAVADLGWRLEVNELFALEERAPGSVEKALAWIARGKTSDLITEPFFVVALMRSYGHAWFTEAHALGSNRQAMLKELSTLKREYTFRTKIRPWIDLLAVVWLIVFPFFVGALGLLWSPMIAIFALVLTASQSLVLTYLFCRVASSRYPLRFPL